MPQTLGYYPAAIESPAPGTVFPQYYTNVRANLAGELPPDVLDLLQTQAAEYGISSGLPGSQFAGYRGLRNLGLTSLQRMDVGAQEMQPLFAQQSSQERYYQQDLQEREAMAERARAAAAARSAEASKWWTMGGGTPTIVGGQGGGMAAGGFPGGKTNASQVVSNILSRYSPYGTSREPLLFEEGPTDPTRLGQSIASYYTGAPSEEEEYPSQYYSQFPGETKAAS